MGEANKLPASQELRVGCHEIMIFDDVSDFTWISEIEADFPQLCFRKLPSFEDVDQYLNEFEKGRMPAPEVLAIDVHTKSESFEMLVPGVELVTNRAGFQLYEELFRKTFPNIDKIPTIFFTSWYGPVSSFEGARLAKKYGNHIVAGSRKQFRDNLLRVCMKNGWITEDEVRMLAGPGQDYYIDLFHTLVGEFRFTADESCSFMGILSGDPADVATLLRTTELPNERIDHLLAVSLLLDTLGVETDEKRTYLLDEYEGDRRLADLLISGMSTDLLRLKAALEKRAGGKIL